MTESQKIFALVDAPPNDGLNLCGDADKFHQDALWSDLLKSQVRTAHAKAEELSADGVLQNSQIAFGVEMATCFYEYLRVFCSARSARLVADHILRLAMTEMEKERNRREKSEGA